MFLKCLSMNQVWDINPAMNWISMKCDVYELYWYISNVSMKSLYMNCISKNNNCLWLCNVLIKRIFGKFLSIYICIFMKCIYLYCIIDIFKIKIIFFHCRKRKKVGGFLFICWGFSTIVQFGQNCTSTSGQDILGRVSIAPPLPS